MKKALNSIRFSFGCRRQSFDCRDYRAPYVMRLDIGPKVTAVDIRRQCQFVDDQEHIGSCAANAITGLAGFLFNYQKVPYGFKASRAAVYYGGRLALGTLSQDSGMTLRDGMKWIATWGLVPETVWPYDGRPAPNHIFPADSPMVVKALGKDGCGNVDQIAAEWKLDAYHLISDNVAMDPLAEDTMKNVLRSGYPFAFGMEVFSNWFDAHTGDPVLIIPMPDKTAVPLGGHAMLCVGFDDATGLWAVRNSWGTGVGDHGYFYIPYAYMKKYSYDPWVGFHLTYTKVMP